jgi:hypothetical protein
LSAFAPDCPQFQPTLRGPRGLPRARSHGIGACRLPIDPTRASNSSSRGLTRFDWMSFGAVVHASNLCRERKDLGIVRRGQCVAGYGRDRVDRPPAARIERRTVRRLPQIETGLIAGAVGYLPDLVEPPGDGNLLICCSRPPSSRRPWSSQWRPRGDGLVGQGSGPEKFMRAGRGRARFRACARAGCGTKCGTDGEPVS